MRLQKRPVNIYDLPLSKDIRILRPESAILRFSHGKSVDLGSLCYLQREPAPKPREISRKRNEGRRVVLSSLSAARVERVLALITHISDDLVDSGRRVETVRDCTTRFVVFMSWADENGYHDVLNNVEAARPAVVNYAKHVRERVDMNLISNNSGARQQATVFGLLGEFLEVDNLTRGINLLRPNSHSKEATVPPDETTQARVLSLCDAMFGGLTSLVLDEQEYPYSLAVPKYLNYPDDRLWLFPTISWFMSSQMLSDRQQYWCPGWGYNYLEGRLTTVDELSAMADFAGNSDKRRRDVIKNASKQLQAANGNLRHPQRLHAGMNALNVFVLLFLAQTGMNWAQVVELTWAEDYEVNATHQVFRTIKWRANNRLVSFELPVAFMPKFRRYLELRKYLLGGRACDFLFFKLGTKGVGEPAQIKSGPRPTYNTLQRIDPGLPAVMPRQWRAAKSDWLVRNTDPSTAALVLQNSEKTVLASYATGSESAHLTELSAFLDKMSETVVEKGTLIEGGEECALGVCSSYGVPQAASAQIAVQPDCKGAEGCLFCDKFKVHADEVDARKLLSCRYCLRQTAHLAGSEEQFQSVLGPILNRIQEILDEVARRDASLVPRVAKEVDEEGELDHYWARKLEMMMDLGLVV